jgi:hypothetical protein
MGYRPAWRLPLVDCSKRAPPVQSAAFKAARLVQLKSVRKCEATAKSTGKQCGHIAMRGTDRCHMHGGRYAAERAESERMGRPIVRVRRHRQQSLGTLGAGTWPGGLPHREDLDVLGPKARGVLFEAWYNRELDPETWKREWTRPRIRK